MSEFKHSPLLQLPNVYRAFYGGFPQLTAIQQQTIQPILGGLDVVVQAATGAGKTEAVLAPCLEQLLQSQQRFSILYIIPTRALATDLKRRLQPIFDRLELTLGIRTGDAKRGGSFPDVMLTTPESLDVMLGSRQQAIQQFVARLKIIIIDEVHTFLYRYRGQQLVYCMQRLNRRRGGQLQKIALSATIAKPKLITQFFVFATNCIYVKQAVKREIVPHLIYLKQDAEVVAFVNDLYERLEYRKLLIFANSRRHCDQLFGLLNTIGRFQGCCGLHYSNLQTKARQQVEQQFRQRQQALCISTSTLELGIDIGDVDSVILFEPPDSVAAFLQRIGRANRRQQRTVFWGICRDKQADIQLLRFMALLHLARQGQIETIENSHFPSVLIQQTASCLYEKQQLSLTAMQDLLPQQHAELAQLWPQLQRSNWLKETRIAGLFKGGWRYYDALINQAIWHNFPPNEEDYGLQLEQQTIANLPRSVVDQLLIGDQVQLAGKQLQVVDIIHDKNDKRVISKTTAILDEKEIFWLGAGFRVTYEVSQTIKQLLAEQALNSGDFGLFSRTRTLLQQLQQSYQRYVTLANGIQVGRLANGNYSYWTFLGALGNVILKWLIEEEYPDIEVVLHDLGFECSVWLDFQHLSYPIDFNLFQQWVGRHLRQLLPLFSLNAYSRYLPRVLLIDEVAHLLFDSRFITHFNQYQQQDNTIVAGDESWLVWQDHSQDPLPVLLTGSEQNLLALEKQRRHIQATTAAWVRHSASYQNKPLTASCIGSYFYHQQCQRWLSYQWLPVDACPPQAVAIDHELQQCRLDAGQQFEQQVLTQLSQQHKLIDCAQINTSLSQQLLLLPAFFEQQPHASLFWVHLCLNQAANDVLMLDGIGIPDLIRITTVANQLQFEVGDIKASHQPRYHQKWQVASYVWLLQQQLAHINHGLAINVVSQSFIITRALSTTALMEWHSFDHQPYLQALPALFLQVDNLLQEKAVEPDYQMQSHCALCEYFENCYQQSLQQHDIQYLPQISKGLLQKCRQLGINTLTELEHYCHQTNNQPQDFSPQHYEQIHTNLTALQQNHIQLKQATTHAYPANVNLTFLIMIYQHPVTGFPCHFALQIIQQQQIMAEQYWLNLTSTQWPAAFNEFQQQLVQHWQQATNAGQVPFILDFDGYSWQLLQQWSDHPRLMSLWQDGIQHQCSLIQLLTQHFYLPIIGTVTYFKLNQYFKVVDSLSMAESLWHHDPIPESLAEQDIQNLFQLQNKVWFWLQQQLTSHWQYNITAVNRYLDFVDAEKYYAEEQVLRLQRYPLAERVARYRAIGPVQFCHSDLDEEGHFRYLFEIVNPPYLSKFRAGDFLKLAPLGTIDIQQGFAVILIEQQAEKIWLQARGRRLNCDHNQFYSLEEDLTDWNTPKLKHALQTVFADEDHPLNALLNATWPWQQYDALSWLDHWLQQYPQHGLNNKQCQALQLPFQYRLGLIEGPPGTGKTHLLVWTIIALVFYAQSQQRPLRIVVTALTHQAIDQVLIKITQVLNQQNLPPFLGECYKWGRWSGIDEQGTYQVQALDDVKILQQRRYLILGATSFGLYQLFESKQGAFPQFFDWVIFDESSQVLIPQALLALLYGKGQFLFYGDDKQLPPIVMGHYPPQQPLQRSILAHLLSLDDYQSCHVRLNQSYRMNQTLCQFPSDMWYDGELQPDAGNQYDQLELKQFELDGWLDNILNPDQPVSLVLLDHQGCEQQSPAEADLVSQLTQRLLIHYQVAPEQLALISPHRAQNNLVAEKLQQILAEHHLDLPLIDTIERVQGAENDVIIFSLVVSNLDNFTEFINNPRRFNVAITRARKKLIVIGSQAFFSMLADNEDVLTDNQCFKKFEAYCRQQQSLFYVDVSPPYT